MTPASVVIEHDSVTFYVMVVVNQMVNSVSLIYYKHELFDKNSTAEDFTAGIYNIE